MELEEKRERVMAALAAIAVGIKTEALPTVIFDEVLEALGAALPDPAHERVKVLEAEARAQQVVLDAFNASVKILKHENGLLREALSRAQWYRPMLGCLNAICTGCGVTNKKGQSHSSDCPIDNALNPKTEPEPCPNGRNRFESNKPRR